TGNGRTTVTWIPSPEADTDGYIIVFNAPGGAVIVDTVWGGASSSYEWEDSTPGLGPESFAVAAFDTCMTGDPPSPNTSATQPFHTTVHLSYSYDPCTGRFDLTWSPYVGWAVVDHSVHMRTTSGAWSVVAILDGSTTAASVTVDPFSTYEFVVVASQGPGLLESISNRISVYADHPGLPAFNYLRTVTVSDQREITVVDSLDVLAEVSGYRLERSVDGGAFEVIAVRGAVPSNTFTYVDTDVEPATRSYRYRVVVLDDCGQDALISNIGGNILLRVTPDLYGVNTLSWNGYQEWAGSIAGYRIFRQVGSGPEELLTVASAQPWNLADDVGSYTASTGLFCYTVLAMEVGNPSGIDALSESNRACAVQQDLVYIPNAFVPGGVNDVFKPELAYTDVALYELSIINRWGQVFWTTNDPREGWDGTAGGQPVPMGVYAYYCKYRNGSGREVERRGTVTMLTAMD
ncbi:MAG: gliding motility-associated C-terminal domain-containing protein, partial [Flavobacteriales bacterium]|nr:gliding motility-associated C-terminal domain-containing protein [Flavobacteriales bacterium]